MSKTVPAFQLRTTTRYDPVLRSFSWNNDNEGPSPLFLLRYHVDRLLSAAKLHGWTRVLDSLTYEKLKEKCLENANIEIPLRVGISVYEDGSITVITVPCSKFASDSDPTTLPNVDELADLNPDEVDVLPIYLDSESTPTSLFTMTKTTHRKVYEDAIGRRQKHSRDRPEVLLYNPEGKITETIIFNVAFFRNFRWVTPSTSTGCLPGVMRRWLLEQGRIHEDDDGILTQQSVQEGEFVLLFNGLQGVRLGKVHK